MANRERVSRLSFLCCGVVACGMMLIFVSVASVTAGSSLPLGDASGVSPGSVDRGMVELPGGMDPIDVVRMVERNRGEVVEETSRPRHAAAAGEVGSAFQIGGPGPAPNDQTYPAVAFDGTNYLVVWIDERNAGTRYIYGARVSTTGGLLDPSGIAISTTASYQMYPDVAFDGTNYLVVWMDFRNGNWDIYGSRVNTGGSVLDPAGIAISTAVGSQRYPTMASDGTNYLVAWDDDRNGEYFDIYGARVSAGGSVLDPAGIAISTAADDQLVPAMAFDGAGYLVVWQDYRNAAGLDIYGARVTVEGSVLDPSGIAVSTSVSDQAFPAIVFGGTGYLVVWYDYRGAGGYADIYGTRVTAGGAVLNPTGIPISTAANHQYSSAVAFDGANYLVVWRDYRSGSNYDIYGARVTQVGSVLDPEGMALSTGGSWDEQYPAMNFDGTNYLVVWTDARGGSYNDIYGTRVNVGGTVLDPAGIAVSTAGVNNEEGPAAAFDGTNYLVVWSEGSSRDIYGARVDVGGMVLDPTGIAISTAMNEQLYPAVAFDGTNYLVVWEDGRGGLSGIYGARVSTGGTVLDTLGIPICTGDYDRLLPAIAFDGTNYLVAWTDLRNEPSYDVYGARVSPGGSVLDVSGIAISTAMDYQGQAAIAFDGTNYLVTWTDYRSGSTYDIYGARVTKAGIVLDASGIAICTAAADQYMSALTFCGTNYLVVWADYRSSFWPDIYGARVSAGGGVLDASGIAISAAADNSSQNYPVTVSDGTNYVVVWQDDRNGLLDIYGARVSMAGAVLDPDGVGISTAPEHQYYPCAGVGPTGQVLIGYGTFVTGGYNYYVIWGNMWGGYVGVENEARAPAVSGICASYPNPFNPVCTIRYEIAPAGRVSLRVFDVRGSVVRTLVDGWREPGVYSEAWEGRRDDGAALPSGVYFCRLESGAVVAVRKIVLVR